MKYIKAGNKDVSIIGAGCMRIARMNQNEADAFVKAALDAGINFFDHADIYGGGKSEEIFGGLFASQPALRDKMFIQSKCAIHDGLFDFSKDYILKAVDGILSRLHTDHIDSLLLHRPDALMEPQEVGEAFAELHQSGKVGIFGVSNMNPMQMELLKTGLSCDLWASQIQMSIAFAPSLEAGFNVNMDIDPSIMRDGGILEYCRLKDMAVQTWSPLQKGYFKGVFIDDPEYEGLNAMMQEIATKYKVGKDTIAYAWNLRYPAKMQVITGTTKPERLLSAAQAADITLTKEEWYGLYKASGRKLP